MNVAVIGTGYVGLVAGACFADSGNSVWCVDKDLSKLDRLRAGELPIYEPGLDQIVERSIRSERLKFTTSIAQAVTSAEIVFIAVGTPPGEKGLPDVRDVKTVALEIGKHLTSYTIIVNKSTMPVGFHQAVAQWIGENAQAAFDVVSNPEFLREGSAVEDFVKPDRVVIGTEKESVYQKLCELYSPFVLQGNPIIKMDPVSAELTKYACNAFLAARISFMNELSQLCEAFGGDIEEVREGMSTDFRIGKHFLYAGAGYGGSCFPKDVKALIGIAQTRGVELLIPQATETINARQKQLLARKVKAHFGGDLKGKTFAFWGLSFKPNTDDMREAPSLEIARELLDAGARVKAYDPVAHSAAKSVLDARVEYCQSIYQASEGADAALLITEWNEFRQPDWKRVQSCLKQKVLFDGRNIYSPEVIKAMGFKYFGIGRRLSDAL